MFIHPTEANIGRTTHVFPHFRNAQTTFVVCPGLSTFFHNMGIDKYLLDSLFIRIQLTVLFIKTFNNLQGVYNENADSLSDLRSSKTDAIRVISSVPHILDELFQLRIVRSDVRADLAQQW